MMRLWDCVTLLKFIDLKWPFGLANWLTHWSRSTSLLYVLTFEWLTFGRWVNHLHNCVTSRPGQLSLVILPWAGAKSTSKSWDVSEHTARCITSLSMVLQCKLVFGWGLRKRRSAPLYRLYFSRKTLRLS